MLANLDFDGEMDYGPLHEFDGEERHLKNFMGGDWAWKQVVCPALQNSAMDQSSSTL